MGMKVRSLFLHGFFGGAEDFSEIRRALHDKMPKKGKSFSFEAKSPSLFHPDCSIRLGSFEEICADLRGDMKPEDTDDLQIVVGYSMGGRIGLELLKRWPKALDVLVLVAAHPGLKTSDDKKQRIAFVEKWRKEILGTSQHMTSWKALLDSWNQLPLFKEDSPIQPRRKDLSQSKLALAIEKLGLHQQSFDLDFLRQNQDRIHGFVGEKDEKYKLLYENLQSQRALKSLQVVEGAGHRVLQKGSEDITRFVLDLLNQKGDVL
jgi:2-succinyl-6-hydroxy-2,4-cyclohexadiene-1-carboxylate synthase